jgi:hypothetical protein
MEELAGREYEVRWPFHRRRIREMMLPGFCPAGAGAGLHLQTRCWSGTLASTSTTTAMLMAIFRV